MRFPTSIRFASISISAMLLLVGVLTALYVNRLQRLNSEVLNIDVSSIRAAEETEMEVREIRHELERFLLTDDLSHLNRALQKEDGLKEWIEQARKLSTTDLEKGLVIEIRKDLDEFFGRLRTIVAAKDKSDLSSAVEDLEDDILTTRVLINTHQYLDRNEQELQQSNDQNRQMAERLVLVLMLLGTCGAIGGLVAGYGLARGIKRSIFQLSVPIRDMAGKLSEVVGPVKVLADPSVTDLEEMLQTVSSEVGALVEQLHVRHREIIRADQLAAVGQLAAGLAHELRNPLMCMKTLVQSAKRSGDIAQFDFRDLTVLDEEISRLENLLQSFMDFARPAKPETRDVDIGHVIRQTVRFLSRRAECRNVKIGYCLPKYTLVVVADENQLRQVLLNLLLNALDAVPNGGEINVTAEIDSVNGQKPNDAMQTVCLQVSDNGRGLPVTERERIYEPFFSTKETGLGLGLAISKRIIEAHGGQLSAQDREKVGTIFEIQLPSTSTDNPFEIGSNNV